MDTKENTKFWESHFTLWKFNDPGNEKGYARLCKAGVPMEAVIDAALANGDFLGMEEKHFNVALNEGLALCADLIIGAGGTVYSNANAYIGVGDDDTTAAASQTGLQAAVNKAWEEMDTSYPSRSSQTLTFKASFEAGDGTFTWKEVTVVNASSDTGTNLLRKTGAWGTKGASDVYTMQINLTLS